jgi:hypothetical protein
MAQKSAAPRILAALRPYLENKMAEYALTSSDPAARTVTLPLTRTGKLDVRKIVQALAGQDVSPNDIQHLYKNKEIRAMVNAAVTDQGIYGIGEYAASKPREISSSESLELANRKLANTLAEKLVELSALRDENRRLRSQLEQIRPEKFRIT